MPRDYKRTET